MRSWLSLKISLSCSTIFAAKWGVKIAKFVFSIIWGTIQVQKTLRIAVFPCIEKIFIIKLLFEVPKRKVYRWVFLQIEIQSHMVKLNTLADCGLEISKKNYTQLCKIERFDSYLMRWKLRIQWPLFVCFGKICIDFYFRVRIISCIVFSW